MGAPQKSFWEGRRVLITGHTGFKGSWLALLLHSLGAELIGYSLPPPTTPSLFQLAGLQNMIDEIEGDIRDFNRLRDAIRSRKPEIVFHLAAQALVCRSYENPIETYATNIMGTVNLLEAVRVAGGVKAVVNVTSDKCYENREWVWGYRETERMGGYDPYASSKGCAELVTAAYRNSYFNQADSASHGVALASARAGNVIGGGDWAENRLIPDCVRAVLKREKIMIRRPASVRPWQHVLEPLHGYIILAEKLCDNGIKYAQAWNFGPDDQDARSVSWVVARFCEKWGNGASYSIEAGGHPYEANYLKLDCSKARTLLDWRPLWNLDTALDAIVEWTAAYQEGTDLRKACFKQIEKYESARVH